MLTDMGIGGCVLVCCGCLCWMRMLRLECEERGICVGFIAESQTPPRAPTLLLVCDKQIVTNKQARLATIESMGHCHRH